MVARGGVRGELITRRLGEILRDDGILDLDRGVVTQLFTFVKICRAGC